MRSGDGRRGLRGRRPRHAVPPGRRGLPRRRGPRRVRRVRDRADRRSSSASPRRSPTTTPAALQVAFGTAWHMLFTRGGLRIGETVLVNSVSSGIGSAAVQLAQLAGAYVIGTSSSPEKLAAAAELGMDAGIDYTTEDIPARVAEITGGRGVDLVFEHVGGELFEKSLQSLAQDGRLVTCGAHAGEVVAVRHHPVLPGPAHRDRLLRLHARGAGEGPRVRRPRPAAAPRARELPARRGAARRSRRSRRARTSGRSCSVHERSRRQAHSRRGS